MKGRKPKPASLKIIDGTYRKDYANLCEPKFNSTLPKKPALLKGAAATMWRRIVPVLFNSHCLTEADIESLTALCFEWGEYTRLARLVKPEEYLVQNERGSLAINPLVRQRDRALANYRSLAAEFGLSPSSRSRIETSQSVDETNPFAKLLMAKNA